MNYSPQRCQGRQERMIYWGVFGGDVRALYRVSVFREGSDPQNKERGRFSAAGTPVPP